ncbi:hypothetical protein [Plantactinospora sp. CA-290183]|uniref:hypothetical protein n=1 Tax=Plantactinospora sp. CA-290183 TaxID=3240006 RepID=UPI003D91E71A
MARHHPTHPVPRPRTEPSPPDDDADTWRIREESPEPDALDDLESVFALANGHLGVRGALDEGSASGMPNTYLNSLYEEPGLTYPENGYAFPERTQTVIGAPDGTPLRLFVADQPLDVRDGGPHRHERVLDLRAGTLERTAQWTAPSGEPVRVTWTRLVSLVQPAVLAIRCEVTALDRPLRIRLHSDLRANPELADRSGDDPRAPTPIEQPLVAEEHAVHPAGGLLAHRTRHSGQRVAAAVTHLLEGASGEAPPPGTRVEVAAEPDLIRTIVDARLAPGQRLTVTKLVSYAHSGDRPRAEGDRTRPAGGVTRTELVAAAEAALDGAPRSGAAGPDSTPTSGPTWTTSGTTRTCCSTAIRSSSRRYGSRSSTSSRRPRTPGSAPCRRRASAATATTATPCGTRRSSCCRS